MSEATPGSASAGTEARDVELAYRAGDGQVEFDLDEDLYPLDAIYGAAYIFVDRCYVFLTRPGDRCVCVRLRGKEAMDADALVALAGEFGNELLNQVLRTRIARSTSAIREQYMARAFFTESRPDTISELLAELDAEELDEDSLEVPVPWETGSDDPTDRPGGGNG